MNNKTSFVKQAAILAIASILVRFIGFLYRVPLTNLIGDVGNAVYGRAYIIYTFLLIISSAGLPAAISKMVSERMARNEPANAYRVFRVSLTVSAVAGLVAALVLGFGARQIAAFVDPAIHLKANALKFLSGEVFVSEMILSGNGFGPVRENMLSSMYAIMSLAPTVLVVAVMSSFRGYFQGLKNNVPTAASQVIEQIFNAVFSILMAYVLMRYGIEFAAAGGTIGTGIGAFAGLVLIAFIYIKGRKSFLKIPRMHTKPEQTNKIVRELFSTALPIIAGVAIFSITNIIDMVMVTSCLEQAAVFTDTQINALYGQLTGKYVVLVTLPVSIATALATTVVPHIAAMKVENNYVSLHHKINVALKLTMVLSIPAAMGVGVLAGPILRLLFQNHPEGASLLTIGAISIVFLSLAQITTGMLQGIGKVKIPAVAAFVGALVKIPINFLLIPNPAINIHGAVISTIACYMVAASIDLMMLVRYTGVRLKWNDIFTKPALASVVMGIFCYVFYNFSRIMIGLGNAPACLLAVAGGVLVYFVYMLNMGGITAEDMTNVPAGDKLTSLSRKIGLPI